MRGDGPALIESVFMNIASGSLFPNRRLFAALLLTVMTVLASLAGTGYGPPVWWAGVFAWLAGALLWPQLAAKQKRQAFLLSGIGLVAYGITLFRGGHPAWMALLTQNTAAARDAGGGELPATAAGAGRER